MLFDDTTIETYSYLDKDVRKVIETRPQPCDLSSLMIGDFVDCKFQNGACNGAWYRECVANISKNRDVCDVVYFDGMVSAPNCFCG